jgi:uncharacterized membrane protein
VFGWAAMSTAAATAKSNSGFGSIARREAVWAAAAALLVAAVPFAAFTALTLHHFYVKGGFFWDSGLLTFLMSQADPWLHTPPLFGGDSFFATHFTPIFIVLSPIRQLLPLSDPQFFAVFCGFCHALPGLAAFWLLYSAFRLRTVFGLAIAAVVGIAFCFNGLALAIARYPHFEMLIVGTALLFFVALARGRPIAAGVFFAACLATREDAGFHLFGVLFLLVALNRYRDIALRDQRREIVFAAIALTYSLAVLLFQHAVFGGQSSFARIYLGEPALVKLSLAGIGERLLGYMQYRTYLVLPAIVALFWAARTRNPYILLGYAAFLPWALLHLIADSDLAGTLSAYYAFPFMIAAFWPLLGILYAERTGTGETKPAGVSILAFAAMIGVSFTALGYQHNPGGLALPANFLSPPSLARQRATETAIATLTGSKAELGTVFVDGSVLALAPAAYRSDETLRDAGDRRPNAVIYFEQGYEANAARTIVAAARLDNYYQIPGTSIRLATARPIDSSSPLATLLVPAGPVR